MDLSNLPDAELESHSNRPFWLDDPEHTVIVVRGSLNLFLAEKGQDGKPGPRLALATLEAGHALIGTPSAEGLTLLASGTPGTQIVRTPRGSLHRHLSPEQQVELMNQWVLRVGEWLRRDLTVPSDCHGYQPGDEVNLAPGERANAAQKVIWCSCPQGSLTFLDSSPLPPQLLFPMGRITWIRAQAASAVKFVPTAEALQTEAGWEGLREYQRLCMEAAARAARANIAEHDNRIAHREERNSQVMARSMDEMATVMPGGPSLEGGVDSQGDELLAACQLIGRASGLVIRKPISMGEHSLTDPVTAISDASRCRNRKLFLRDEWYHTDSGAILGFLAEDNAPVAILPAGSGRYDLVDPRDGRRRRVTKKVAAGLSPDAYCFYRPLPDRSLSVWDLIKFCLPLFWSDLWVMIYVGIAGGILNLVMPIGTGLLISEIIPSGEFGEVKTLAVALIVATLANSGFSLVRSLTLLHLEGKLDGQMQAALMDRLVNLPAPFFRNYSTGDLTNRVLGINAIRKTISGAGVNSLLGGVFSIFSFLLLFYYSWKLALVGTVLVIINFFALFLASMYQLQFQRRLLDLAGRISGMVFQFLTGINKLRVAGAEARAFAQWAAAFSEQRRLSFRVGMIGAHMSAFNAFFSIFCTGVLFGFFAHFQFQGLSTGEFLSFFSAFGQFMGAIGAIGSSLTSTLTIGPTLDRAKPILQEPLEVATLRPEPATLEGRVEMNQLSFRYRADGEYVLQNVNIYADPGEFIAIVGPSGAGKSTMLRLLLGFEIPEKGTVLYDGQNLQSINAQALRRQVGVVLQNSQLMAGDIISNIVGSTNLTEKDAWEAAELAGIAADIKALPMGMHTVIMEGSAGFSGGQRQRLLIARAVVSKPRVLFFDEATSALDSDTQEAVSRGLEGLQSTRVVIAHRLSTIRRADRIYVMSDHTVKQVGTYESLIDVPGIFQELAKRQLV